METNNEMQYLKNALNHYGLTGYEVHQYHECDKRRKKNKYFITDNERNSLTGHWSYDQLNHFISGYGKAVNKYKSI